MPAFFSSNKSYPLTLKPLTPPAEHLTYNDVFNLQNTLRALFRDLDSGASEAGSNVVIVGDRTGVNNNYVGYTLFVRIPGYALIRNSHNWKIEMYFTFLNSFKIGGARVYKTLPGNLNVISSVPVTIDGQASPVITNEVSNSAKVVTTDAITEELTPAFDHWFGIYFSTDSVNNVNVGSFDAASAVKGNYVSGDQLNVTLIPVTPTNAYMVQRVLTA